MADKEQKELERIFKAFANRRRIAILKFLKHRHQASVGEIAGAIKLSFRATSKHLSVLFGADILDRDQQHSLQIFYRIADSLPPAAKQVISLI